MEPFSKNGYILACAQTREATFIDPRDEAPVLLGWVAQEGIRIISIVNTHAHVDHISGVGLVKHQWDVPILSPPSRPGPLRRGSPTGSYLRYPLPGLSSL